MKLFNPFQKQDRYQKIDLATAQSARSESVAKSLQPHAKLESVLKLANSEVRSGRYRTLLYRFLADNIPIVDSCLWTWSRLAAAPGKLEIVPDDNSETDRMVASNRLINLMDNLIGTPAGGSQGETAFLVDLFLTLFRDGLFGGFLTVKSDGSGVDRFVPVDSADLYYNHERPGNPLVLEHDNGELSLERPDFYYMSMADGRTGGLGRSILSTIPFVAYIEQQLVDDMRRSSHNSGFHRLHVKIAPPERMSGESDQAYIERINGYFDSTVNMIKNCDVDDNPVTWDNVNIEHVGPQNSKSTSNNWFMNHRAMVEEICAGTHLAPFLLGYSYGDTTTWSAFKFDLVMRQVTTLQAQAGRFLEWVGNIDLALAGLNMRCQYRFDNVMNYQAADRATIQGQKVDGLLRLYESGLIDEAVARTKAGELL